MVRRATSSAAHHGGERGHAAGGPGRHHRSCSRRAQTTGHVGSNLRTQLVRDWPRPRGHASSRSTAVRPPNVAGPGVEAPTRLEARPNWACSSAGPQSTCEYRRRSDAPSPCAGRGIPGPHAKEPALPNARRAQRQRAALWRTVVDGRPQSITPSGGGGEMCGWLSKPVACSGQVSSHRCTAVRTKASSAGSPAGLPARWPQTLGIGSSSADARCGSSAALSATRK